MAGPYSKTQTAQTQYIVSIIPDSQIFFISLVCQLSDSFHAFCCLGLPWFMVKQSEIWNY